MEDPVLLLDNLEEYTTISARTDNMAQTTGLLYLQLVAGTDINSQQGDASMVWENSLALVANENSFQINYGTEVENPSTLLALIGMARSYPIYRRVANAYVNGRLQGPRS